MYEPETFDCYYVGVTSRDSLLHNTLLTDADAPRRYLLFFIIKHNRSESDIIKIRRYGFDRNLRKGAITGVDNGPSKYTDSLEAQANSGNAVPR